MTATDTTIKLDDTSFQEAVAKGVTLVDFWAEWCMPCRMQGPILETLAKKIGDKAKIAKLNVDESPAAAQALGITSIPTLIIFKDGEPVAGFVGVQSEATLQSALEKLYTEV